MIGFLFSLLRFKLCFQSLQIPSTKKAGQISPVPTWALNTLFMGDLQGEMGENCKPVQQFNSSLSPQESGSAVVSLISSITKLADISEIETLAIRRW